MQVGELKRLKNRVIGNPSAKKQLATQPGFVALLVDCLGRFDLRIEAAHIIASISYGDADALASLLRADTLRTLLYALSNPADPAALRAFARALRTLAMSVAEAVGPSRWGLGKEPTDSEEARATLDYLFHIDSLDLFLPLLVDKPTTVHIAELVAFSVRSSDHRKAVTEWIPPAERMTQIKTRRGWEKSTETVANGGWVVRTLVALVPTKDIKLQEAVLLALAALAKDNPLVSRVLIHEGTLTSILDLCKARNLDVQLAACLSATHILRADPSHSCAECDAAARTIISVINRFISDDHTPQNKNKACFILYYLVTDDPQLSRLAYERSCLQKLSTLLMSITPPAEQSNPSDLDSDEPESISALREAALTTIASIALFDNDIRRSMTDDLHLLPLISVSLASEHVGVKYGACQCVRAVSRSVEVLRTSVVDSGLGLKIFELFKKETEDRRIVGAAIRAVCNIVCEFSPLRPIYLDKGLMPRLVQLISGSDSSLRLNALWAIKNLVRKTSTETKKDVMRQLGWARVVELLGDSDEAIVEQALNILRNLAENEEGIAMVFKEVGTDRLLGILVGFLSQPSPVGSSIGTGTKAIAIPGSTSSTSSSIPPTPSSPSASSLTHPIPHTTPSHDILLQTSCTLANLSNGTPSQQSSIVSYPSLLPALRQTLAEGNTEIRRPIVGMLVELVKNNHKFRREMIQGGLVGTLKGLVSGKTTKHGIAAGAGHGSATGGGGVSSSPTSTTGSMAMAIPSSPTLGVSVSPSSVGASLAAAGRSPTWHGSGGHAHAPGHGHTHSFGGRALTHSNSSSGLGGVGHTTFTSTSTSSVSYPFTTFSVTFPFIFTSDVVVSGAFWFSRYTSSCTHSHPSFTPYSRSYARSYAYTYTPRARARAHAPLSSMSTSTSSLSLGLPLTPSLSISAITEDDKDVIERARQALDWLEHGDVYTSMAMSLGLEGGASASGGGASGGTTEGVSASSASGDGAGAGAT
ncbi:hypothetical protein D9758_005905 [Tetrapyrgos nigripes]|uniref:Armadillo repeat-containing protein 8 n=1 Tax=Tetrapyrgos nigripes TaxID=182062 RepID=A0A8H5G305_9AGAR|nr:hypothetical protein D9758_005905 [Tetrapyrgos nigripes]